ncbi:MAG: RICIN domain-containing protein [Bacteroidales bacterium]|nr:RICIN domain-containing protein [Bacteroidales bacterium]
MTKRVYFFLTYCSIVLLFFQFNNHILFGQQLAFPGAEGFGRYVTGGRGGTVYHVTNLNDDGPGSFRDAVSQGNRIVVFEVGGIINISSRIVVSENITIAGQTAPGDGIVIYGNGLSFSGANNTICRYLRVRMGINGDNGKDAITIANGANMIFDHISVSWGRDETFSISWDSKGTEPSNITIQNSIIAQGLVDHSCGGLIQTSGGVSLLRNLYIDNKTRNPKVKGVNQFVNNIIYNWGTDGYILGDSEGDSYANIIGNYFIEGPNTSAGSAFTRGNMNFHLYASDNYLDNNENEILDGQILNRIDYTIVDWITTPHDQPEVSILSPVEAYDTIVAGVGASLPTLDEVDLYLLSELTSLGTLGQLISIETETPVNGCGIVNGGLAPKDNDRDGMPDEWEFFYGLNPFSKDDQNTDLDSDGYINIEEYLNQTHPGQGTGELPDGEFTIEFNHSNKLIAIKNESLNDSAFAVQQTSNKKNSQFWSITQDSSGYYNIINKNSQMALTVKNQSIEENIPIVQFYYTGSDEQLWQIQFIDSGFYSIINKNSSKSLDINAGSKDNGAQVVQKFFNGSSSQKFKLLPSSLLFNSPVISIIYPNSNLIFTEGSDIEISAFAKDFDGNILKVEFYNNNNIIYTDTAEPYNFILEEIQAGTHNIKIMAIDDDSLVSWSAVATITVLTAGSSPCTIQENMKGFCGYEGTIDNNHAGFTGDGFVNTTNNDSSGINWKVYIPEDGNYTINWRYANGSSNRPGKLIVNNVLLVSNINFPGTGDWPNWDVTTIQVNLDSGITDIRLESTTADGLANIDFIEVSGDNTSPANCIDTIPSDTLKVTGSILIEWYAGITGKSVYNLVSNEDFPYNPFKTDYIKKLEAPVNFSDNYGTRIRGFLNPLNSEDYTFWISGDEECQLWLSTDTIPSNSSLIAKVPEWTGLYEWDKYNEQQSESITLEAGSKYYIEVLHKEADGDDHMEVAWSGPDFEQQIIDGAFLSPWTDTSKQGVTITSSDIYKNYMFKIYPNPVHDFLTLELSDEFELDTELKLYNNYGQLVIIGKVKENTTLIDLSELKQGLYILKITDRYHTITTKLMKY